VKKTTAVKVPAKKAPAKKAVVKKAVPAKKAVPLKPLKPLKPVKPVKPATKAVVKKAVPAKKAVPVKPAKKAVPVKPVKPVKPAKKAVVRKAALEKKAVPVKPAKKAVPLKPVKPAKPVKKVAGKKDNSPTVESVAVEPAPVVKTVFEKLVPVTTPPAKGKKAAGIVKVISPRPVAKSPSIVVREDESPWTKAELNKVRKVLNEDEIRLMEEITMAEQGLADLINDSGDGAGDDQADAGSKTFEREHEMSMANNARDMLEQVRQSLARIDDRSYGVCDGCGQGIGKLRLQAFPRATLCMSCKVAEERV
jgi:RNA polymerase-binding protein DksA